MLLFCTILQTPLPALASLRPKDFPEGEDGENQPAESAEANGVVSV